MHLLEIDARCEIYSIVCERDSGHVTVNGVSAPLAQACDRQCAISFANHVEVELTAHGRRVVHLDRRNRLAESTDDAAPSPCEAEDAADHPGMPEEMAP